MNKFASHILVSILVASVLTIISTTTAAPRPQNPRQIEAELQEHNAARLDRGGSVTLELLGKDTIGDSQTMANHSMDGNVHSRCVVSNPPYAFHIELVDELPVSEISFICSDYEIEQTPKDIVIELSDGTRIEKTLEVIRPANRRDKPRQTVEIQKSIEWVKVTVLNNYPGGFNSKGKQITWGGIGEIEVITTADLDPYMEVPDYNPQMPVYIEGASPRNNYSEVKVTMPNTIPFGQHPGIYLTRDEIVAMRDKVKSSDWSTDMYHKMIDSCNEWLDKPIVHPDPAIPAQMNDRGDAQARAHDLLSKMAGWFAWAYQMTDDERYAQKARQILVGYAKLYPNDYKEHKGVHSSDTSKIMAQRLSEAMWLIPLIQAYDMVHDAPCMTDQDRELIETDLIRHCIRFINKKRSAAEEVAARDRQNPDWRNYDPEPGKGHGSNWLLFYNMAYVQGGIVLQDQDWIDIGMANVKTLVASGIKDDGMWGEGAIGYQLFARHALIGSMEALARKGYDMYGYAECRAKNLWDSSLKYAYPDGTAPGINDSGRANVASGWYAMAYDYGYLRYNDTNYGQFVNDAPRQIYQSQGCYFPTVIYDKLPVKPMKGLNSLVFDSLGYGILRGNDGGDTSTPTGDQTFLLMDYGVHGGTHGHPDKLNLILFAEGDELAGEPQPYRYENPLHREWTRPTIAHWTVAVDQRSQVPDTGRLTAFYDAGDIKVMRGDADSAYAGVGLDRTVVQMPGYIVDIFRGWGTTEHTFDYPLCFRGELDQLASVEDADLKPMGLATQPGYKHIRTLDPVKSQSWAGAWQREFVKGMSAVVGDSRSQDQPTNHVKAVVLVEHDNAQIFQGKDVDGRHRVVFRQQAQDATFFAAIDPYKASDAVESIESFTVNSDIPARALKVNRADGATDLIIVRYNSHAQPTDAATSFAGGQTNANVSVIRLDKQGRIIRMGMVGGTKLEYQQQVLELTQPGIMFSH